MINIRGNLTMRNAHPAAAQLDAARTEDYAPLPPCLRLRLERPADYRAAEEMTRDAFWVNTDADHLVDEHLLVHKLRQSARFVPELDFVAEMGDTLVGQVLYSRAEIRDARGEAHPVLTFGPLTVRPEYQNQGVGTALMRYSLAEARRLGHTAVVVYGHANYYPRFGFRRAGDYGLTTPDGQTFDGFMAMELYPGALDGIKGSFHEDALFYDLPEDAVRAFDALFPPKAPLPYAGIRLLLERLTPPARQAVEGLGLTHLREICGWREESVAALPGIDRQALDTIRAVLREHGRGWGAGLAQ